VSTCGEEGAGGDLNDCRETGLYEAGIDILPRLKSGDSYGAHPGANFPGLKAGVCRAPDPKFDYALNFRKAQGPITQDLLRLKSFKDKTKCQAKNSLISRIQSTTLKALFSMPSILFLMLYGIGGLGPLLRRLLSNAYKDSLALYACSSASDNMRSISSLISSHLC